MRAVLPASPCGNHSLDKVDFRGVVCTFICDFCIRSRRAIEMYKTKIKFITLNV